MTSAWAPSRSWSLRRASGSQTLAGAASKPLRLCAGTSSDLTPAPKKPSGRFRDRVRQFVVRSAVTDNAADARFCNQCATPLNRVCPKCAHLNAPDAKFCSQCAVAVGGQAVDGSDASASPVARGSVRLGPETQDVSAALDGERKIVTALFADIKGSMELMEDLDPEDARAIVDP